MTITSNRALGVMLSGAALAGWLAGSTLNPPVAVTQTAPPRPASRAQARVELPHVAWPAAPRRVAPPASSRNPFSFRAAAREPSVRRATTRPAGDGAAVAAPDMIASDAPSVVSEPPVMRWRLSGIGASEGGDIVAIISGGGEVFLMRAGEALPGGDAVVEVGPASVVMQTPGGPVTLRLP